MTLEQFAYLGQIVAAIAVVASLVYIGSELRQNTQALEAQSRFNLISLRTGFADLLMQDRGLLEALHKYVDGEDLTKAERTAVMMHAFRLLETWEWQYSEFQAGTLPRDRLPVGSWRQFYHERLSPTALPEAWRISHRPTRCRQGDGAGARAAGKDKFQQGFVQYVEESVPELAPSNK